MSWAFLFAATSVPCHLSDGLKQHVVVITHNIRNSVSLSIIYKSLLINRTCLFVGYFNMTLNPITMTLIVDKECQHQITLTNNHILK